MGEIPMLISLPSAIQNILNTNSTCSFCSQFLLFLLFQENGYAHLDFIWPIIICAVELDFKNVI